MREMFSGRLLFGQEGSQAIRSVLMCRCFGVAGARRPSLERQERGGAPRELGGLVMNQRQTTLN